MSRKTLEELKTLSEKEQDKRGWRWWDNTPEKLGKLEQAFAIGCTDKEACGFAGISEDQLYYYEKKSEDFTSRKAFLKDTVVLKARQAVAQKVDESYGNAMDYLKRVRRKEFGDNVDVTTKTKELGAKLEKVVADILSK